MLGSTPSAKDWAFCPTFCWHTLQGWSSSVFVTAIADYLCQVARFREDGFDDGNRPVMAALRGEGVSGW